MDLSSLRLPDNFTHQNEISIDQRASKWSAGEIEDWPRGISDHGTHHAHQFNHASPSDAEFCRVYTQAVSGDSPHHDVESKLLEQLKTTPISLEQLLNEVKGIYAGLVIVGKQCVEMSAQQAQITSQLVDKTRLISLEQLVNEVKGIYTDLGMVEKKCVEICAQQAQIIYQLVNEAKGIYAGLVMVEKKCVEICAQQAQPINKLSREQWQALIALHRTLLHKYHDFFLSPQHPAISPAPCLLTIPTQPTQTWKHGIHSFLDPLRHRFSYSLEHMLSFVYLASWMMGLLMESVSPTTDRIQHHLRVLTRLNIVRQLFYYSKALISVNPFSNTHRRLIRPSRPHLLQRLGSLIRGSLNELCKAGHRPVPRPQRSTVCRNPDSSATCTAFLALCWHIVPAAALSEIHTNSQAPGYRIVLPTAGAELAESLVQTALCWTIPLAVCLIWNAALYVCGPARRTELLAYGGFTWSIVALGLFDRATMACPQSKLVYFLETQLVLGLYLRATVQSRLPERKSQVADLCILWGGAGVCAGAFCAWAGGSLVFPQVFPFFVLTLIELAKHLLLPGPPLPLQVPLLPV